MSGRKYRGRHARRPDRYAQLLYAFSVFLGALLYVQVSAAATVVVALVAVAVVLAGWTGGRFKEGNASAFQR